MLRCPSSVSKFAPLLHQSAAKEVNSAAEIVRVVSTHNFVKQKIPGGISKLLKIENHKSKHSKRNQENRWKLQPNQKSREKRVEWKEEEFNLLRAQSLLNFSRKRMAYVLRRDDRLIFSKLQKHILNLIAVEKFIKEVIVGTNAED